MTRKHHMLAVDWGATSGRTMLGTLENGRLSLKQTHRFQNEPVEMLGRLYWDVPALLRGIMKGMQIAAMEGIEIESIGIDTWGVDYALLDEAGRLISNPVHYRDSRTDTAMEQAFGKVSMEDIYGRTGLAFMPINTLYQLYSEVLEGNPTLKNAKKLLLMPDLFAYLLTGEIGCEYTMASTTQMINPKTKDWDVELIGKLGIPTDILPPIEKPGSIRGYLHPRVMKETGVASVPVVAVGSHDTASAVAAVPARDENFGYISSGTWSLLGVEAKEPVISDFAKEANLTNEGGVDDTIRVLKNVMGMWIIEELRRDWERSGQSYGHEELKRAAEEAKPFVSLIDPNDQSFTPPGDMIQKVQAFCEKTGQPIPKTHGQLARCVYESLALKYRWTVEKLKAATGKEISVLHMVGGGSNNELLNRFTADALGIAVVAGPSEATAIGNLLMQAQALGIVENMQEGRRIVGDSFGVKRLEPELLQKEAWDRAFEKFLTISVE